MIGDCEDLGLDFKEHFLKIRPQVLAVTEDDQYEDIKRALCAEVGAEYIALPKTPPQFTPISSSSIVRNIRTPAEAPLRVDFGGGWLDVPRHAREGAYIVNCAISPMVSLNEWDYELKSGLGGSGAWALLNGNDGVESELNLGVGWQDPAIIRETGACVWRSGARPELDFKQNGDFLRGHMALHYTDIPHDTPANADNHRDYDLIEQAAATAREAVFEASIPKLGEAVGLSYTAQAANTAVAAGAATPSTCLQHPPSATHLSYRPTATVQLSLTSPSASAFSFTRRRTRSVSSALNLLL